MYAALVFTEGIFLKKQDKRLAELCEKLLLEGISSMTQRELFEIVLLFCDRGTDAFTCEKYISRYRMYTDFITGMASGGCIGDNVILSGLCKLITETAKLISVGAWDHSIEETDFYHRLSEYCRKDSEEHIKSLCRQLAVMNYDCSAEVFRAMFLDGNNRMIWYDDIARGDFGEVYLDFNSFFRAAIARGAKGILVAHNHPDGDLRPSVSDVKITERLKNACENVGIRFIDHIIVCFGRYRSVCDPENNSSDTDERKKFPEQIGQTGVYRIGSAAPPGRVDDNYFYDRAAELFCDNDDPIPKWNDIAMRESDDEEGSGC